MNPELAVIFGITLYKIGCLTVGSLFALLGYRLFQSGIWGNAGNLDSKFKDAKIVLKSAAPGTFFAVLGAGIIVVTIWQGINFDFEQRAHTSNVSSKSLPSLP